MNKNKIFILLFVIIIFYILYSIYHVQSSKHELDPLIKDARTIRSALVAYTLDHGHYPYDPRGADFALHGIKIYLDAYPGVLPQTHWQNDKILLNTSQIFYLNEPFTNAPKSDNDIILWLKCDLRGRVNIYRNGMIGYEVFTNENNR